MKTTSRILLTTLLLSFSLPSRAADITWTNTAGGSWATAANWSPNQVPSGSDSASIPGGAKVLIDAVSSVGGLSLDSGASLTVMSSGVLNLAGGDAKYVMGGITNRGTVNWQAGYVAVYPSGGGIWNEAGAVWDIQCDNPLASLWGGTPVFRNAGVLRKSAGTGTTDFRTFLDNTGMVQAQSGILNVTAGCALTNGILDIGIHSLTNYGLIQLNNSALAGTISATVLDGYRPAAGASFPLVSYNALSGLFTAADLPFCAAWEANYSANTFSITVLNSRPQFAAQSSRAVNELTTLTVTNSATDVDSPANTLVYSLLAAPTGASINAANGVISWMPTEAQGPSANVFTTRVVDNGTPVLAATNTFTVVVNEVNAAPVLPGQTNRVMDELTLLTVTNAATDSDIPGNVLTYALLDAPSGAAIDTNGVIPWMPTEAQGPGTNTITTRVVDNGSPELAATNSFEVVVNEVNLVPMLTVPASQTINELALWSGTATATDPDLPANTLTIGLVSGPAGLAVAANGQITWTPTEAQGLSTNTVTVRVSDNGVPVLGATNSFTLIVSEVNSVPVLPAQTNRTITELTLLTVTNTATDGDLPTNTLSYSLLAAPAGALIDTNTGVITWTPTEAQGPSTNTFTTRVVDNGSPALAGTNSYTVTVNELNVAPVLTVPADQTINELTTLNVTATATDADLPANGLQFALVSPPPGMAINATSGAITWMPTELQGQSTNEIWVSVTDTNAVASNVKTLSVTNSFTVIVNEVSTPPTLTVPPTQTITELATLTVTNLAGDGDWPANTLTFALLSGPGNAVLDAVSGVLTWTPTEEQGPSTNTLVVSVTDFNPWAVNAQALTVTNSFVVIVTETNAAPILTVPTNDVISELALYTATATATDSDIPTNALTFTLVSAPTGMVIGATSGVITWTPSEAQGPGTNEILVSVTDTNAAAGEANVLTVTNRFTLVVNELNTAPQLPAQGDRTIGELAALTVTNTATDVDLPANALTYLLLDPPAGAGIDANGVITWTPAETQGATTNVFTTVVTDASPDAVNEQSLSATNSFTVAVNEVNVPPLLTLPADQTIDELAFYTNNAAATDADLLANALTFALVSGPAGLTVSPVGAITWTPEEAQGPSTNVVWVSVTDMNPTAANATSLSVTGSFTLIVRELNTAPVLTLPVNQTIHL